MLLGIIYLKSHFFTIVTDIYDYIFMDESFRMKIEWFLGKALLCCSHPGCNQFWIFGMSWTCHYEKMTVWS